MRLLLGTDRIALAGTLPEIAAHHHATPAVVVGIDAPLRIVAGRRHEGRAVLLAPGFTHAVDVRGRIAVFLLPPHAVAGTLRDLPHPARWIELGRAVLDQQLTSFSDVDRALGRGLLGTPLDERVTRAIDAIADTLGDNVPVAQIAERAGLSPSRLMALAREQLGGTSLRTYRRWLRTFAVARAYASGASLTTAAIAAGFASSAHLSAAAREHFGIRPSHVLAPGTAIALQ